MNFINKMWGENVFSIKINMCIDYFSDLVENFDEASKGETN